MTYGTDTFYNFAAPEPRFSLRSFLPQNFFATAAVGGIVLSCAWILGVNLDLGSTENVVESRFPSPAAFKSSGGLFDPTSLGFHPGIFVQSSSKSDRLRIASTAPQAVPNQTAPAPAQAAPQVAQAAPLALPQQQLAQNVPLPLPRPANVRISQNPAPVVHEAELASADPTQSIPSSDDEPSVFQKFFGKSQSGPTLAYATPDGGISGDERRSVAGHLVPYDRSTAVYDISAHVVYLPDGTKLEAHSGLGSMLDDPRYARERMRGVTPPHVYDLTLRESLFHGVQAIRLNPVGGDGGVFGRSGLLAHTYMLGPRGDSNGCVSFRNYEAFLRAYMNHEIKRLAVVDRLG